MDNAGDGQRKADRIEGPGGAYANDRLNPKGNTRKKQSHTQQLGIVLCTKFLTNISDEAIDPTPWVNLKARPDVTFAGTMPNPPMLCHYVAINGGSCVAENYDNEIGPDASSVHGYTRVYQLLPEGTTNAGFNAFNHRGRPVMATMMPGRRYGYCKEEDFLGTQNLLPDATPVVGAAAAAFTPFGRRRTIPAFASAPGGGVGFTPQVNPARTPLFPTPYGGVPLTYYNEDPLDSFELEHYARFTQGNQIPRVI